VSFGVVGAAEKEGNALGARTEGDGNPITNKPLLENAVKEFNE
jgi:hypothetical protein